MLVKGAQLLLDAAAVFITKRQSILWGITLWHNVANVYEEFSAKYPFPYMYFWWSQ